jgi:hypothetical protein
MLKGPDLVQYSCQLMYPSVLINFYFKLNYFLRNEFAGILMALEDEMYNEKHTSTKEIYMFCRPCQFNFSEI